MEFLSAAWLSALLAIVLIGQVIGLLVSVPIVVFGSTMVHNLVERFRSLFRQVRLYWPSPRQR